MRIDRSIETHVRAAFYAVVSKNSADLKAALRQLSGDKLSTGASYAAYVCAYVVNDVFKENLRDESVTEMAQLAVDDNKEWFDLGGPDAIAGFLKASANGDESFAGVPQEDVPGYSFVLGGYLLSHYSPTDQPWFEYLDDIWNSAQAADS